MKNVTSFDDFLNEKKVNTKKEYALSHKVQDSIKKLCESMLHEEAKKWHEDDDKSHTYEGYMNEAKDCMNECMNECCEVWKASGASSAGMK